MTIKTFWTLLIKIFGLWLLLSSFAVIPTFFSILHSGVSGYQSEDNWQFIFVIVLVFAIYLFFVWLSIFKPAWIIEKLKLDSDFPEEKINLSGSFTGGLRVAIIIFGGFLFIDSLAPLCKDLFVFFQQKILFREDPNAGWMIFFFLKVIAGYLIMTNSRSVTAFINKQKTDEIKAEE